MTNKGHWVFKDGKFIPYSKKNASTKVQIKSSEMAPTVHPCDGKVYTSKTKFRETTKAYGCVEVGDDKGFASTGRKEYSPEGIKEDILKAWSKYD